MKRLATVLCVVLVSMAGSVQNSTAGEAAQKLRSNAEKMLKYTQNDTKLYPLLGEFCDKFPRRLSGTPILEEGIDWLVAKMKKEGLDVSTQPVMVPHWVRGAESLRMLKPLNHTLQFCGLGGSIGTKGSELKAQVIVVNSFDDLRSKAAQVKGKIVVYNVPFVKYSETVGYRYTGPSEAARYGAVASLVRSIGPFGLQTVHTGMMAYNDSLPKIPCGAISMEDAMMFARMQERGETIELALTMNAEKLPDAPSRNIVVEIKGKELPNEIVVVGGHIDAWDNGTGAMDDGGGCFISWRVLTMIRELGLTPKRTIRCVFWTNEENGTQGAKAYAKLTKNEKHLIAFESDAGTFAPYGFSCSDTTGPIYERATDLATLLEPIKANSIEFGEGGADTGPLNEMGVPVMELLVDNTKYFWYHHTNADTIDKLDPKELNNCVYAMAIMAWGFSEL